MFINVENHGLEESKFLLCYHLHDEIQSNKIHATQQLNMIIIKYKKIYKKFILSK